MAHLPDSDDDAALHCRYSALREITEDLAHLPDDSVSEVKDLGLTVSAERPDVLPKGALTLVPRAPWMLEGDSRSDAEADADWHAPRNSVALP